MADEESFNAAEVAGMLGVGKNKVYELAKTGELPSYRIGRKLRFSQRDIDAYLQAAHDRVPVGEAVVAAAAAAATGVEADPNVGDPDAFTLAGNDVSADFLANQLNQQGLSTRRVYQGSYNALVDLYRGKADVAFLHLYDMRTNKYNVPFVQRVAPGMPVVVVRLYARVQGYIVVDGNPKHLTTWGGLLHEGVRLANREKGSGSRILLDQKLISMEAVPSSIEGYENVYEGGGLAARAVARGEADVALGLQRAMEGIDGLEFIPMQKEFADVAVAKTDRTRPLVREVKRAAGDPTFQAMLAAMGGGVDQMGAILYEC